MALRAPALALLLASGALVWSARADELSGADKLRLLYSHGFVFGRDGLPVVTVEIMSEQREVRLTADAGMRVLPDGEGGAEVLAGKAWTITAQGSAPAKVRHWVIVSRSAEDAALAQWKQRGYEAKVFEIGVVFGVEGNTIDSRESLLGIAPEANPDAAARAAKAIAEKWKVETSIHPELVEPPRGTLVARDASGTQVRHEGILWFAPDSPGGTITVADVIHGHGGSQVGAEKRQTRSYLGRVFVTIGSNGKLTVVNAIPEDRLLMGLVPSEMFPDAPGEALAAQAVAARTELLAKIGTRHFVDPYVVCSSQHCQVYGGVGLEDERTSKAVRRTRGEVIMRDGGGGLVQAYYSASCGGFSENNENIWALSPDPSLRGKLDLVGDGAKKLARFKTGITEANLREFLALPTAAAFCGASRYGKGRYRWRQEWTGQQLDAVIASELPSLGNIRELRAKERGVSGRIRRLEIVGSKSSIVIEGDLRIRRLLGGLKSTLFSVSSEKTGGRVSRWILDGAGFGHGVGMCQTGAIGMAEAGRDYRKILGHYYPGSHVHSLY